MLTRLTRNLAVPALLGALLAGSPAGAQEAKLRAGLFLPPTTGWGVHCKRFIDHLNEIGKGQFQIQLLGPDAVPPFELGNAISTGVMDMGCLPSAYYKGKMVEAEATVFSDIPFLEHRKTGAWDLFNKIHNEKVNAWYLGAYGDGVKFHFYANKDIKSEADFKGLKVRSAPNYQALLASLGATPVTLPPGEVYTALERGTVDAYGWPFWGIHDMSWDRYSKVRIDPGFYNGNVHVLFNLNKWKALTDAQRKLLTDGAIWLETNFPKWRDEMTAADQKKQDASGIKSVNFGPGWAKKAEDIYFAELEKQSPENMRALYKAMKKQ